MSLYGKAELRTTIVSALLRGKRTLGKAYVEP
jgi:hypothetical protein